MTGAALPVLDRLTKAAEHLGEAERRLAKVIVEGYPASVAGTPVRLLRRAAAAPVDLDRLFAAVDIADFDQLREIALREADRALSTPAARFSARLQRQSSAASAPLASSPAHPLACREPASTGKITATFWRIRSSGHRLRTASSSPSASPC